MPLIMPNFIVLGQTMFEKSVAKYFESLQYFGAPGGPLSRSSPILALMYNNAPFIKLHPVLTTPLRDICCQILSISLMAWLTHKNSKRHVCIPCGNKNDLSVGLSWISKAVLDLPTTDKKIITEFSISDHSLPILNYILPELTETCRHKDKYIYTYVLQTLALPM